MPISRVSAVAIMGSSGPDEDTFSASINLADGSLAGLTFTSEGNRDFSPKEEVIISCDSHVARIVNYATLSVDGYRKRFIRNRYGAMEAIREFIQAKENGFKVPVSLINSKSLTEPVNLAGEIDVNKKAASDLTKAIKDVNADIQKTFQAFV